MGGRDYGGIRKATNHLYNKHNGEEIKKIRAWVRLTHYLSPIKPCFLIRRRNKSFQNICPGGEWLNYWCDIYIFILFFPLKGYFSNLLEVNKTARGWLLSCINIIHRWWYENSMHVILRIDFVAYEPFSFKSLHYRIVNLHLWLDDKFYLTIL